MSYEPNRSFALFTVSVETYFWASHQLTLPTGSKEPLHHHNWSVTADVGSDKLDSMGFFIDFHSLKAVLDNIVDELGNCSLNKIDYFRRNGSSAENIAKYIYEKLQTKLPKDVNLNYIKVDEEPGCSAKFGK